MDILYIVTRKKNEFINITNDLQHYISQHDLDDATLLLHIPHTTAAITINENADPDVKTDLLFGLADTFPNKKEYLHFEGNSDAHLKSSLIGTQLLVIVENGRIVLGTWQGIYFCEFDGPRRRMLYIKQM